MPHYDKDAIREALDAHVILGRHGLKLRRSGAWYRSRECPGCGMGQSAAFAIHEDGHFACHRCDLRGGDVFDLLALLEGLDIEREFPRVLEAAADVAGIQPGERPNSAEMERRRRDREEHRARRREEQRATDKQRRERAISIAGPLWESLAHRHKDGETYLEFRGLEALIGSADIVRFDYKGNIRIPLHDALGHIVSVPGRRIMPTGDHDKIVWMKDCPTSGTFGRFPELKPEHKIVYLCEGIIDYLTGLVMFPDAFVLGAHGAANLPKIASGIAPMLKQHNLQLCLVPHIGDAKGTGIKAAAAASKAAKAKGMPESSVVYIRVPFGDLNDHHLRQRK